MKKGKGMRKGSAYEREICKQLSRWWTDDKREDVFWRTAGSGARAKVRDKTGKSTFGQYGDIQAIDPIGQPLLDLCTIEIKRGYSGHTFADLIESSENPKAKAPMYFQFMLQAKEAAKAARTYRWMIIVKRNRRTPIVILSHNLYKILKPIVPYHYWAKIKTEYAFDKFSVYITTLELFLRISPRRIRKLMKG